MKYLHWYIQSQIPTYEISTNPTIHDGQLTDMSPVLPAAHWISSIPFSIIIFFNTAKSAEEFGNDMINLGYEHLFAEVHGMLNKQQRAENLAKFMKQETAKILLCTDACARGLDLPFVKCIVQAEFSLNVVQHLHRVGRSSRGGKRGFAVNFFSGPQEPLVRSIKGQFQQYNDVICNNETAMNDKTHQKTSIEESFSRRRGFRRNLRKQEITINNTEKNVTDN